MTSGQRFKSPNSQIEEASRILSIISACKIFTARKLHTISTELKQLNFYKVIHYGQV